MIKNRFASACYRTIIMFAAFVLACVILPVSNASANDDGAPVIIDNARVLDNSTRQSIDNASKTIHHKTGTRLAVITTPDSSKPANVIAHDYSKTHSNEIVYAVSTSNNDGALIPANNSKLSPIVASKIDNYADKFYKGKDWNDGVYSVTNNVNNAMSGKPVTSQDSSLLLAWAVPLLLIAVIATCYRFKWLIKAQSAAFKAWRTDKEKPYTDFLDKEIEQYKTRAKNISNNHVEIRL